MCAQVTKDGVPVLWHDDDVVFGDSPSSPQSALVKDLTLEQFTALCGPAPSAPSAPSVPPGAWSCKLLRRFRDKATHQWRDAIEPWTAAQDDVLPSLDAVFRAVPAHVGFDIEVKMTTGEDVVNTPQEEIDRMLTSITRVVDACTATSPRNVFYSSFDPDICAQLAAMQARFPVYFLSGCGLYTHADPRRTSIPAALDFAAHNKMAGVVPPASVLMANQGMVADARARGLATMTYGLENNDLASVRRQGALGVQAAIIDDVEAAMASRTCAAGGAGAAAAH